MFIVRVAVVAALTFAFCLSGSSIQAADLGVSEPAEGASPEEVAAGCTQTSPVTEFPLVRCAWFKAANKIVFDPGPNVGSGWQISAAVNELEDRAPVIGNLIVGNCANHPSAPCVKVGEVDRPAEEWRTRFQILASHDPNDGWINLNVAHGRDRASICHSSARILGLSAHTTDTIGGCSHYNFSLGSDHLAAAAVDKLRAAYSHGSRLLLKPCRKPARAIC